ncbi:MAG: FAD-dependent oxidoreductase [Candidatus Woesearchaeota archaeon]
MTKACKIGSGKPKINPTKYDLVIIGGGPAGMGCAVYSTRYKLNTAIISSDLGGLVNQAPMIENYLGYSSIVGSDLVAKFVEHVKSANVPIFDDCVVKITMNKDSFEVHSESQVVLAKNILIASGLERRKLDIPGEKEFEGRGVTYCATCDAPMFKGFDVAVVGGGDAAAAAAVLVAKYAKQVYLVYRGDKLRAEPFWQDKLKVTKNVSIVYNANLTEIRGNKSVESVKLDNGKELKVRGIIVEVGSVPTNALVAGLGVDLDDKGFIKVDAGMRTNVPGVYAAGDVCNANNGFKQIITAVASGSIASNTIFMDSHKSK